MLVRLDEAIAYFTTNNPENQQLAILGRLRRNGHLKLEDQFRLVGAGEWKLTLWRLILRVVVQLLTRHSPTPQAAEVNQKIEALPVCFATSSLWRFVDNHLASPRSPNHSTLGATKSAASTPCSNPAGCFRRGAARRCRRCSRFSTGCTSRMRRRRA